jgi:hypothetical protein
MVKWISKSEYARKYELNRSSVTKAVQNGRLPVRGEKVDGDVDIRKYRRREPANDDAALRKSVALIDDIEQESNSTIRSGGSRRIVKADEIPADALGEELQRARIDKLNADIAVQRQKDLRTRQNWRREDLAEFSSVFAQSFAPFKNSLVKLRLDSADIQALGAAWDKCYSAFLKALEDMELADNEADSPDQ